MCEIRVLVAESNPTYLAVVRQALANSKLVAAAIETAQGCRVVEDVGRLKPDVALLDVHLPECSGLAIAEELRAKKLDVKVILMLSDDGLVYRSAAHRLGAGWVAKDRLADELPAQLEMAATSFEEKDVIGGKHNVDRLNVDMTFGSAQRVRATTIATIDWRDGLVRAIKPALAIFVIGAVLLGLTAVAAWSFNVPIDRDDAGGSRVVDDLGLFGKRGAIVQLNRSQTDEYVAAKQAQRQQNLAICISVGALGLAIGSALIAWNEVTEKKKRTRSKR